MYELPFLSGHNKFKNTKFTRPCTIILKSSLHVTYKSERDSVLVKTSVLYFRFNLTQLHRYIVVNNFFGGASQLWIRAGRGTQLRHHAGGGPQLRLQFLFLALPVISDSMDVSCIGQFSSELSSVKTSIVVKFFDIDSPYKSYFMKYLTSVHFTVHFARSLTSKKWRWDHGPSSSLS